PASTMLATAGRLIWSKHSFSLYECRLSASVSRATRLADSICLTKLASSAAPVITFRLSAIRSRVIQRWSWSHANYRSAFPSLREVEALPSFCAASARAPIHLDDTAVPRAVSPRATDGSPGTAVSPAERDRDAIPYCLCP